MPEKNPGKIDQAELERIRTTELIVLQVVAGNFGLPFPQLSERFSEILGKIQKTNGGTPIDLGFGPGNSTKDLEQFMQRMSNGKSGLLRRKEFNGASTFEITQSGHRTLVLGAQSAGVDITTTQF